MNRAERIAFDLLSRLGYRDPIKHGDWVNIVTLVETDIMLYNDDVVSLEQAINYELGASVYLEFAHGPWLQSLAAKWVLSKAIKKHRRYLDYITALKEDEDDSGNA